MRTCRVTISGKVQGVFFRAYTKQKADELLLSGWVRNMPDGSVEALIYGAEEKIESMLSWFHRGSPEAVVSSVVIDETAQPPEELDRFNIIR